jgi:hypothetical protein
MDIGSLSQDFNNEEDQAERKGNREKKHESPPCIGWDGQRHLASFHHVTSTEQDRDNSSDASTMLQILP